MYNAKLKELQQRKQCNQGAKTDDQTAEPIKKPDSIEKSTPDRNNRYPSHLFPTHSLTKKKLTVVATTQDKT